MPNDCSNSFTITNVTHDQWCDLAATFQIRERRSQDFLKTFCAEPDWQNTPNDSGELPSPSDEHGTSHFQDGVTDQRWYEWRNQHWGTKWDAYCCANDWGSEVPSENFSVKFSTAWMPPNEECMAVISMKFPGSLLINHYREERMDFFGVTVAKDGVVRNLSESSRRFFEHFIREQYPDLDARLEADGLSLEDNLHDFFEGNCDLNKLFDYIHAAFESIVVPKMIQEIEEIVAV